MAQERAIEIGLVLYQGAQQACVLGLTDLFYVANRIAGSYREQTELAVRVTHWRQNTPMRRLSASSTTGRTLRPCCPP